MNVRLLVSNGVERMGMEGVMAYFVITSSNLPAESEDHHGCLSHDIAIEQHFALDLSNTRQ